MKFNFGMSEVLLIGSIYIYQQAFTFSMVLLTLSLLGKALAFSIELQKAKEKSEASKEITKNIVDSFLNAITLSGIANAPGKNGFH